MAGKHIGPGPGGVRQQFHSMPPDFMDGALGGQQAHFNKTGATGEKRPPPPSVNWLRAAIDYLVDRLAIRQVVERVNIADPVYQPPWVVPPYRFYPIHETVGAGDGTSPFVAVTVPAGGAWTTIYTHNPIKGRVSVINQFGFELSDPGGGPANIPYEETQYRIVDQSGKLYFGPTFGAYGTFRDPIPFPIVIAPSGITLRVQFANVNAGTDWRIALRVGGWQWEQGLNSGRNSMSGIVR
jgi:hypothetical protein